RAAVDPVKARVLQGERIVGAHEQIGDVQEERLRAYRAALAGTSQGGETDDLTLAVTVGGILFNALILGIIGALLYFFRQPIYNDWRSLTLIVSLILTVAMAAALIAQLELPAELIPVTF